MSQTAIIAPRKRALVAKVVEAAAQQLGVQAREVMGKSRSKPVTAARHVAMASLYWTGEFSSAELGSAFDRDHTSVLHAVDRCGGDEDLQALVGIVVDRTGL